jgi:D-alanyl-D-alanine carboxypeptidase (penicillin-binding protein 5/6)
MSAALVKYPLIKNYSTVWMDSLRDGKSELVNTNRLIRFYSGAFGLKTGTTSKAGSCLSAAAEREGLTLIAVVMGSPTSNDRFNGARKLLDYGFANYSFENVEADITDLPDIEVKRGGERFIRPITDQTLPSLLPKGSSGILEQEIEIADTLVDAVEERSIFTQMKTLPRHTI